MHSPQRFHSSFCEKACAGDGDSNASGGGRAQPASYFMSLPGFFFFLSLPQGGSAGEPATIQSLPSKTVHTGLQDHFLMKESMVNWIQFFQKHR